MGGEGSIGQASHLAGLHGILLASWSRVVIGTGMIDAIIRPAVYGRCHYALHGGLMLIVEGQVERSDSVVNVLAET
jgi:hypothetical protein